MFRPAALVVSATLIGSALALAPAQVASAATWGPDVRVAYAHQNDIFVAHPSGSPSVNITADVAGVAVMPTISRTGRYVSYKVGVDSWVFDFQTGKHVKVGTGESRLEFSPTSDTVAYGKYASGKHDLHTRNADGTGDANRTNETTDAHNLTPSWGSDGSSLLYSRSHGVRMCRMDRGGFDELYYTNRLYRLPLAGGTPTLVAGNDDVYIGASGEGGGTLAYVRHAVPPTKPNGYCASEPDGSGQLVVNGAVVGPAWHASPSVNAAGDVLYTDDGTVKFLPAGTTTPQSLLPGSYPDWGVAFAPSTDCTITGTAKDDRLNGTAGNDVICALGGDDVVFGHGGNDVIRGGEGEDQLVGGAGNDRLLGELDNDVLRGDEGNDHLDGGAGIDLITYFTSRTKLTADLARRTAGSASHGRDSLASVESVFGSKTGDLIVGDGRSNALYGGPGKDVLKGGGGSDLLWGGAGNDASYGGGGRDLIEDTSGRDLLSGQGSRDTCAKDRANDRVKSCERVDRKDPPKTKGPRRGAGSGVVAAQAGDTAQPAAATGTRYWYLGNNDYLVVYSRSATQQIGAMPDAAGQKYVCRILRYTPARTACSAAGALNAVQKYQMAWFLWNAKANGGCAIGILDWGRHGVNQFAKRWKVRPAQSARYNTALPWVTAGRYSDVKTANGILRVYCR